MAGNIWERERVDRKHEKIEKENISDNDIIYTHLPWDYWESLVGWPVLDKE